ncbi:hypothetical protein VPH35_137362 [Triticum aestivum]
MDEIKCFAGLPPTYGLHACPLIRSRPHNPEPTSRLSCEKNITSPTPTIALPSPPAATELLPVPIAAARRFSSPLLPQARGTNLPKQPERQSGGGMERWRLRWRGKGWGGRPTSGSSTRRSGTRRPGRSPRAGSSPPPRAPMSPRALASSATRSSPVAPPSRPRRTALRLLLRPPRRRPSVYGRTNRFSEDSMNRKGNRCRHRKARQC